MNLPKGGKEMAEEEKFKPESEDEEEVEAHRRRVADEATETEDDEGDDVEAHRRRA
jgi:hypothetical protein